ncbi:MAG: AMP-binding protein [Burkholderiales bacterium]|nr:AMP-binding protein [Burkholderiales bacterium]
MRSADQYDALYSSFRWHVPARFNIARECIGRWAREPDRVALIEDNDGGVPGLVTYAALQADANRLANALAARGVRRGDRVAIMLPQRRETVVAHAACYQMGAVAMPLSVLFGPDALAYRLSDSAAVAALVDAAAHANLAPVRAACPMLRTVIAVDPLPGAGLDLVDYRAALGAAGTGFACVDTGAEDPALLIYTSGTTGPPKGALKPHRVLIGNLPGFVASQNWFPRANDVFWSPADWAWTGGLMDALLPTLYFGRPIVAGTAKGADGRFDARLAYALLERHRVTNAFLFPTALKMMMKALPRPRDTHALALRAVMSAGEAVGATVFDWARHALGVTINEMFGQTEINYVVGNSHEKWPAKPGSIGRPYPGHRVAVIDDAGNEVPRGTCGEVAVNRCDIHGHPDPVFFLGYWGRDDATRRKYTGDWCRTGDEAIMDDDGYLWYQGRADDMFKAAGYRIGPSEVENCLLKHPAVANCAVVPKPDAVRGAVVKAYVVPVPGVTPSPALVADIQGHVRGLLAPYEYPREIEFIDALPMTTTGKVQRRVLRLQEEARFRDRTAAVTATKEEP